MIKKLKTIDDHGVKFAYKLCIGFLMVGGFGCGTLGAILKTYNLLGNSW